MLILDVLIIFPIFFICFISCLKIKFTVSTLAQLYKDHFLQTKRNRNVPCPVQPCLLETPTALLKKEGQALKNTLARNY